MKKKILFVFAHPDDEAFGPAGTIAKLSKNNEVHVVIMCNGARPGSIHVTKSRQQSLALSCEQLGVSHCYSGRYDDCTLTLPQAIDVLERAIILIRPEIIYTHNTSDVHQDHRVVGEAALIACRPKVGSPIKELYMCENVTSDWGFGMTGNSFVPDTFVDITQQMDSKQQALSYYHSEIYDFPDARSVTGARVLAQKRGMQVGVEFAEAFKQVFRLA